jgi:hypothetical protein
MNGELKVSIVVTGKKKAVKAEQNKTKQEGYNI